MFRQHWQTMLNKMWFLWTCAHWVGVTSKEEWAQHGMTTTKVLGNKSDVDSNWNFCVHLWSMVWCIFCDCWNSRPSDEDFPRICYMAVGSKFHLCTLSMQPNPLVK